MKKIAILFIILFGWFTVGSASSFKTEQWRTANGVRVVFYPAKEVPMLDLSLAFAAGSAYDGSHFGLSALMTNLMDQGNHGLDATAIAESFADVGSQFGVENNRDMVVFNLRTLTNKDALEQSKKTFIDVINHPDFPDEAFQREKKQLLMAIEQTQESPDDVANLHFFNHLYQNHPYAHPVNGIMKTVEPLTKQQVVEFYKQYLVSQNAVLIMVGAIDSSTAHHLSEQITAGMNQGKAAEALPKNDQLNQSEKVNIKFPSSQTIVRFGQLGIDHHTPNYFPLVVGNYILGGGGLVSRLSQEVREKRGLTYGIDSQFIPMPGGGPFLISLSTKNEEANQAITLTQEELQLFINEGPKQQELDAAKHYLTGSFPLSLASNRSIATLLLRMTFYNLPDNYLSTYVERINAVTTDQIKQAFKTQVIPNRFLLVTVGKS